MSLKVFKVTRFIRRWRHLTGDCNPNVLRKDKLLSRRGERRRVKRELSVPTDPE